MEDALSDLFWSPATSLTRGHLTGSFIRPGLLFKGAQETMEMDGQGPGGCRDKGQEVTVYLM